MLISLPCSQWKFRDRRVYEVPILFLVFNRPRKTKRVFDVIRRIRPKKLYVNADGPRDGREGEVDKCDQVRKIVTAIDWDCDLKVRFFDSNLGCKNSVSSGISWFFDQVPEGIILEDDTLPNISFFSFCENLLSRYRDDLRVMQVTGFNALAGRKFGDASYYFSMYGDIWGWASWRRAWQLYDPDMRSWPEDKATGLTADRMLGHDEGEYWSAIFENTWKGVHDTWDYQWLYCMRKYRGLCAIPNQNLVSNIGFDKEATHTLAGIDDPSAGLRRRSLGALTHPLHVQHSLEADRQRYDRFFSAQNLETAKSSGACQIIRYLKSCLE